MASTEAQCRCSPPTRSGRGRALRTRRFSDDRRHRLQGGRRERQRCRGDGRRTATRAVVPHPSTHAPDGRRRWSVGRRAGGRGRNRRHTGRVNQQPSDDTITADHEHQVLPPSGPPSVPALFGFEAPITGKLATDVFIMGEPAALKNSTGTCPPHVPPEPEGTTFVTAPSHVGVITDGSATVMINGRAGGACTATARRPADERGGRVVATGSVYVG